MNQTPPGAPTDIPKPLTRDRSKRKKDGLGNNAITAALEEAGINTPQVREVVDALLSQQKKKLADAKAKVEAGALLKNAEDANEMMVAYSEMSDEVERLLDKCARLRTSLGKTKGIADKRGEEVSKLKEHIDALRAELARTREQHQEELAREQDKLVTQQNKKMDQLMSKNQKALVKEKKMRDQLQERINKLQEEKADVEQQYDVKVMEYESVVRDYEQSKIESMKKFKEMGGFSTVSYTGAAENEKLRQAVSSAVPTKALSGGKAVTARSTISAPNMPDELPTLSARPPGVAPNPFSRNFLDVAVSSTL